MKKLFTFLTVAIIALGLFNEVSATTCAQAVPIPANPTFPYVSSLTCGTTNDITSANSTTCGNSSYKGGWEAVYSWTPNGNYIDVSFAYSGQTWTGLFLYEGCPTSGGICIGNFTSSSSAKTLAYIGTNMTSGTKISLTSGLTYYLVIDTYPTPNSPCPGTITINGTLSVPCTGTPDPGNTISSLNPACPGVNFTLSLQNVTPGTGVTYQWQSSTTGGAPWTNLGTATTQVTSQTVATWYQCVVTCTNSGLIGTSNPVQVTMNVASVPYLEGFLTTTTPTCWNIGTWSIGSTRGVTGNPGNNIYKNLYSSSATATFITGNIGPIAANMLLSFDYKLANFSSPYAPPASGSGNYVVSVSTDGGGTYTPLETVLNNGTAGWQSKSYPLTAYVGSNIMIRIVGNWISGDYDLAFDNIKIDAAPACLVPGSLTVANKTDVGADLSWSSPDSFFDIFLEVAGGPAPGPGTTPTLDDFNGGYLYTWSGGLPGTTYDWWVRTDCAAGGGTGQSDWVAGTPFTTLLCNPVDQCTYTFRMTDSYGDGWNGNTMAVKQGTTTVQTISLADDFGPEDVLVGLCDGLGFELFWNSGGSYPGEVGVEILDAFGTSLYYHAPGTGLQNTSLFTGTVNCTPPEFVDWCNIQWPGSGTPNEGNYDVYAQVWEEGVTDAPGQGAGINAWIGYSTSNTNPNTWTNWIPANYNAFYGGTDNDEYMLNLGLVIGNNPGIYYYASRFELNSTGAYKYGGFSGTGGGFWDGTTNISGVLTIPCEIYTIPYSQNFDGVTAPAMPSCFTVENVNADAYYWQTNSTYRLSAPNSAYIRYNSSLAMDDWMFLPGLQLTGGKTYEVSFAYASSTSFPEKLSIYWGDSPTSAAMLNGPIFDEEFAGGYYLGLGSFTPPSDGVYYLGFWGHSDMDEFWLSVDDILVTEAVANLTWNGSISNNWHTPGNWNEGMIPASTSNVTIPAGLTNYPTVTSAGTCNNISFGSNAINTATLLDNGLLIVFGSGSVQRYFTGDPSATQDWHLVSSPVAGATASVFMDMYLQSFDETTNSYTEISDPITPLNLMEGYGLYSTLATSNTVTFTGDLYLGTQSKAFTYLDQGWNLVGNPFVSGLDWDAVIIPSGLSNEVHYIDAESGNDLSYVKLVGGTGSRFIAPMQGFFVKASGSGSLSLGNAQRTHLGADDFYKNDIHDLLILQASGENYSDQTWIYFNELAEVEHDGVFDAYKRISTSNPELPQIYSITPSGTKLSINGMTEATMVPVGFTALQTGEFTISAIETSEFKDVILEDLFLGVQTDLLKKSYTFNYNLDDKENRFIVHFTPLAVGESPADLINIYSSHKDVYVSVPANTEGDIVVYNLMGQEVARTIITDVINKVTMEKSAYYVVKVMSNESVVTKKVFVK